MERYLKTAIRLSLVLSVLAPSIGFGERLQPADLVYVGAFRLPDDFNWGARGLSYYPPGNSGAGSLLVTGSEVLADGYAEYGEVSIPTPRQEPSWEDLPLATFLRPMTPFDGGLIQARPVEYVFVSGIQYVPRQGTQTGDKIYGSLNAWYPEGEFGDDSFPTLWFSAPDGSNPRGLFYVGPLAQTAPYHGRKMGEYLFTVPQWYADSYLGGRTLVTGRSRGTPVGSDPVTTQGGSQGPTLFAFRPLQIDSPAGNTSLDALPILYYRASYPGCAGPDIGVGGQAVDCDYAFSDQVFSMCDAWSGAGFVESGSKRAILILGQKGTTNCYYCGDPVDDSECPVTPTPAECATLWCNEGRGYHCGPYERQVIFYDTDELGQAARGLRDPWTVLPYTLWRPAAFYLEGNTCGDVGGMAVDPASGRVFMVERGLGGTDTNAAVVHVWTVGGVFSTDIKANDSDGPVVVSCSEPVSIEISLDSGARRGESADWWIAVHTPFASPDDWYSFVYQMAWQPGIHVCVQIPLFSLSPLEVFNMSLPVGSYTFYFAVDDADGSPSGPWLGMDSVEVTVED